MYEPDADLERELVPTNPEAALAAREPPPDDGLMVVKEVDGNVRIEIPSRPGIGAVLLLLGIVLTVASFFLLALVDGPGGWLCLVPGLALIYLGLDAAADSSVLTLDRQRGYHLKRRSILGVKNVKGSLDELKGAEYVNTRDHEYLALRTTNRGSPKITANCSIAEAKWIAARVNRFVMEERRDDRALPAPR